jgi:hypothetical protein
MMANLMKALVATALTISLALVLIFLLMEREIALAIVGALGIIYMIHMFRNYFEVVNE